MRFGSPLKSLMPLPTPMSGRSSIEMSNPRISCWQEDTPTLLVADFGLAKALTPTSPEDDLSQAGPRWERLNISPEQASGDVHVDGRADVYSLAASYMRCWPANRHSVERPPKSFWPATGASQCLQSSSCVQTSLPG